MNGLGQLHVSAFVLSIREGRVDEYRRRHAAVWPEMLDALRAGGIVHYDIHLNAIERKAYGHVLRDRIPDPAAPEHPVIVRWRAFMADVLEMDNDQPRRDPVEHVFHLTAET